jgi:hypothetical protein
MLSNHSHTNAAIRNKLIDSAIALFYMGAAAPNFKLSFPDSRQPALGQAPAQA